MTIAPKLNLALCAAYVETRPVKGSKRVVLDVIARHVDWVGEQVGSVQMRARVIAEKAKLHHRSVEKILRQLRQEGEIETEKRVRADGSRSSNRIHIRGLLTFAAERRAKTISKRPGPPGQNAGAYPSSKSEGFPLPPEKPTHLDKEQQPKDDLGAMGEEARKIFEEIRAENWRRSDPQKCHIWLAKRVKALGGLEAWRAYLAKAKAISWIRKASLGLAFFVAHETLLRFRSGAYGPDKEAAKSEPEPFKPDLEKSPWLALLGDYHRLVRNISASALSDGVYEANKRGVFGKHAEIYAIWKTFGIQRSKR